MSNPNAFPSVCLDDPGHPASAPGMTLRDWFAGQALIGIVSSMLGKQENPEAAFAYGAYAIADAMLSAREPSA